MTTQGAFQLCLKSIAGTRASWGLLSCSAPSLWAVLHEFLSVLLEMTGRYPEFYGIPRMAILYNQACSNACNIENTTTYACIMDSILYMLVCISKQRLV